MQDASDLIQYVTKSIEERINEEFKTWLRKKYLQECSSILDIKENYPDAFLLFRMGDFYELFYDDAVKAAQILEISLTSRNKNADNPIPMAGVPYTQLKPILMSWLRWATR